ncbi:nucleotidyltransferase family protein [Cetobacterium somerae]
MKIEALGATKIGIFGSYSKDLATDNSDVDILIELAPDGEHYLCIKKLNCHYL